MIARILSAGLVVVEYLRIGLHRGLGSLGVRAPGRSFNQMMIFVTAERILLISSRHLAQIAQVPIPDLSCFLSLFYLLSDMLLKFSLMKDVLFLFLLFEDLLTTFFIMSFILCELGLNEEVFLRS